MTAWRELWSRGRVDVSGNATVARAVYASLFYTLCSLPTNDDLQSPYIGLSPAGLPYGTLGKVLIDLAALDT